MRRQRPKRLCPQPNAALLRMRDGIRRAARAEGGSWDELPDGTAIARFTTGEVFFFGTDTVTRLK